MNEFDYIPTITADEVVAEAQRLTQKPASELTNADKAMALYHLAVMKAGRTEGVDVQRLPGKRGVGIQDTSNKGGVLTTEATGVVKPGGMADGTGE